MTNPINNPGSSENNDTKPSNTSLTQANTAAALLGDNVSPEVDGYTMDVAKYLIAHNRAAEVEKDFLKYSREGNDAVAFALIDTIADIDDNDIPVDILKRYSQWKASQKPAKTVGEKDIPVEYKQYLANAGQLWIDEFLTFSPEAQKKISETIEFTPDTIIVKSSMKIGGVEKNVKIHVSKGYVLPDMKDPKVLEAITQGDIRECPDGVVRSTIIGVHAMIPDELRIKGSTLLAIANSMPSKLVYDRINDTRVEESFKRGTEKKYKNLYELGALLNLDDNGIGMKGDDKILYDPEGFAHLVSGGYAMKGGVSTGGPIGLHVTPNGSARGGRLLARFPEYMAPTMKLARPIEILD